MIFQPAAGQPIEHREDVHSMMAEYRESSGSTDHAGGSRYRVLFWACMVPGLVGASLLLAGWVASAVGQGGDRPGAAHEATPAEDVPGSVLISSGVVESRLRAQEDQIRELFKRVEALEGGR